MNNSSGQRIARWGSSTVSVIDTVTDTRIADILAGKGAAFVAAVGAKVYVANGWDTTVSVIDAATDAKLMDIPGGRATTKHRAVALSKRIMQGLHKDYMSFAHCCPGLYPVLANTTDRAPSSRLHRVQACPLR